MKEEDYDQIEDYLYGRMSEDQASAFEERVRKDGTLAEELEVKRMEQQTLRLLSQNQLRSEMTNWKAEREVEQPSEAKVVKMPRRRLLYRLSAAASILLLIGLPLWWVNQVYSNEALAGNALGLKTSRSDRSNVAADNPLLQALDLANAGNFQEADNQLQALQGTPFAEEAQLLRAEIYCEQEQYNEAIPVYQNLAESSEDLIVKQRAEWLLSNAYLITDQEDQAQQLLTSIASNDGHLHQSEAQKLLKKLNSVWRMF